MAVRGRRPGDSGTREAILVAARSLFAQQGYDRASVRAIAAEAGVDPALVLHFYGSKDGLLAEAIALPVEPAQVLADRLANVPPERVGEELVRRVVTRWEQPLVRAHMLGVLQTGFSHPTAMRAVRELLQGTVIAAVSALVDDESAHRRAELVAAQMAGLAVARYILELPSIATLSPDDLARAVGPSVQHYLTGPI